MNTEKATLADFERGSQVYVPLAMLAQHLERPASTSGSGTGGVGGAAGSGGGLSANEEGIMAKQRREAVHADADEQIVAGVKRMLASARDDEEDAASYFGPRDEDEWEEAEAAPLNPAQLLQVREADNLAAAAVAAAVEAEAEAQLPDVAPSHRWLADPPDTVYDRYSSVLGDSFHLMDRPYVGYLPTRRHHLHSDG